MYLLLASRPVIMRVCLSNWFIGEQTHFQLIDDFSTLRAGSVLHPSSSAHWTVYLFLQRHSFSTTRGLLSRAGRPQKGLLSGVRRVGPRTHAGSIELEPLFPHRTYIDDQQTLNSKCPLNNWGQTSLISKRFLKQHKNIQVHLCMNNSYPPFPNDHECCQNIAPGMTPVLPQGALVSCVGGMNTVCLGPLQKLKKPNT